MSAMNNKNYHRPKNRSNLRIFSGNSHQKLAKDVAKKCGVSLGQLTLDKFANNETSVDLKENVRGQVSILPVSNLIIIFSQQTHHCRRNRQLVKFFSHQSSKSFKKNRQCHQSHHSVCDKS